MITPVRSRDKLFRQNLSEARARWGRLSTAARYTLKALTHVHGLCLATGEVTLLENSWYVTHAGLLHIAQQNRCSGIQTVLQQKASEPSVNRWVFKATVYKSRESRGFTGYGDADPSNVSPLVRGAEMRVAETRAVNRALRKAYGIGMCSVEELGWTPRESGYPQPNRENGSASRSTSNGHSAPPRLRDRLCLLIREHQLDPTLVKAYAADYCGTSALHNASREQVEAFINHLTERAKNDRGALLCHLNSFAKPQEVSS